MSEQRTHAQALAAYLSNNLMAGPEGENLIDAPSDLDLLDALASLSLALIESNDAAAAYAQAVVESARNS